MEFDKKDIIHLANLAKLELKEANIDTYKEQLSGVLSYVEKIDKLDLENIEESISGVGENAVPPRPDSVDASDPDILSQAADKDGDYLAAPNVFEK